MRKFLREDETWKQYKNVEMQWIDHHNPDLVVLDKQGRERERIDLSPYSFAQITELLDEKGFMKL